MRTKEEIQKEIEALQEELKTLEERKFKNIKLNTCYYIINDYGKVCAIVYSNDSMDKQYVNNYNFFLTKEHAEKVAKKQRILNFMEKWNYEFDDEYQFVADNENWTLIYNYRLSRESPYEATHNTIHKYIGSIYFSSREKALQCLSDMKKAGLL